MGVVGAHRDLMPPMKSNRNVTNRAVLLVENKRHSCCCRSQPFRGLASALAVHGSVLVATKVRAESSSTVCVSP